MMTIPLGFLFIPTPDELITCYLLPKALGFQPPCNPHVLEMPLYGENADPTRVFSDVDDSRWVVSEGNDRVIYVLTKLSKINNGKTRVARRAGCGTWSGQTGGKRIKNGSGEFIGSVKMFGFEADGISDDHYHWIMHEYSLAGVYSDSNKCRGMKHKDYVICKIRRTSSKRKGVVVREDDVVAAPSSFKKLKAGPSIRECVPVLDVDDRVDGEPSFEAAMISNYRGEDDCLMNLDGYFASGPSTEEYVPVLDLDDCHEGSNSRIDGVSTGGNMPDSVFDRRASIYILDDDCACPTRPDEVGRAEESTDHVVDVSGPKSIYLDNIEVPDFSLDGFEFNLDGLDSFMGSFMESFKGSSAGACIYGV